jgi:tetratricopeptide (TPR) repeat protein
MQPAWNCFRDGLPAPWVLLNGGTEPGSPTTVINSPGSAASELPLPLERVRPFLDLSAPRGLHPSDIPPVVIQTPLMAWDRVRASHVPWFAATHPQRIAPAPFRTEIARAAEFLGYASAMTAPTLDGWLDNAEGERAALRERLSSAHDAPVLERALLARLLIALGFHSEGQELALPPGSPVATPDEAYAFSTWTYAEQILTSSRKDVVLDPHYRWLHERLGAAPEFARIRLVNCFNGAVIAARRRDVTSVAFWRTEGEAALATFVGLAEIDEFTAALMTSRFYRAMSFLPYLTGDRPQLESDMEQWLGIARELRGCDDRTRLLAADNLFPAVETAVRTETYLGNHARAIALAEELAHEIDPLEPKTWITLAELRFRSHDIAGALEAYLRAASLTIPFGRLAWFNAGQCYERLDQPDEAISCYLNSLALWPTGVTPLRRIHALASGARPVKESPRLLDWVARQPAWPSIQRSG